MNITYPLVCQTKDGNHYIDFYLNKKRYRLFNAKKIGVDFKPNSYPCKQRRRETERLAKMVYDYLVMNNHQFEKTESCARK